MKFRHESVETSVEIRADFFLIITVMLMTGDTGTVVNSILSSILHECGHIAAIVFLGERIKRLLFCSAGLRIDRRINPSLSFGGEILISAAGVSVNFTLCIAAYIIYKLTGQTFFLSFFAVNLAIGLFNLLPIEPLDGAKVLYFILCRRIPQQKAENIILRLSVITAAALSALCTVAFCLKASNVSLAAVTIYLIILLINRIFELKKRQI